jgi:hypothetical protein
MLSMICMHPRVIFHWCAVCCTPYVASPSQSNSGRCIIQKHAGSTARSKKSTTLVYSVHCRETYKEEAVKLALTYAAA